MWRGRWGSGRSDAELHHDHPGPDGSPTPTSTPCVVGATEAPPTAEPTAAPVGETWKGAALINSSAVNPNADNSTCRDGRELEFAFVTRTEGTIEGQGTAELTSAPTCPFPISSPSWKHVEYQVLGEEDGGGFSLRFALVGFEPADGTTWAGFTSMFGIPRMPSGGPPVAVAVSGTIGTGQGAWQVESGTPPATYEANGTIRLECVTCEEAVA